MLWLQCETWASAVLAGALLTLFFAWNVTLRVRRAGSKTKRNDTHTFKLFTGAKVLMIEHFVFSVMAVLIAEILFMLFSAYNTVMG